MMRPIKTFKLSHVSCWWAKPIFRLWFNFVYSDTIAQARVQAQHSVASYWLEK